MIFSVLVLLSGSSYGNAFSQKITLSFANNTETLQEFEQIEGNNMKILDNDTNISDLVKDVEESHAISE